MQPCEQQDKIDAIFKAVDRMEKGQESIVKLLEKVASQDARLDHLEEHAERNYTEMNELFTRLREAEMNIASSGPTVRQQFHEAIDTVNKQMNTFSGNLAKVNRFVSMVTCRYALYVYAVLIAMLASGTFLDFMYHFDTLKAIFQFFK